MNLKISTITIAAFLMIIFFCSLLGCVTDPIKGIKNNPNQMDILMNHIANDKDFRAKMVEKLITTGDRNKLADALVKEEDMSRILLSKIIETEKGRNDVVSRVGNRRELISQAIGKALQMYEYREVLLDAFLKDSEMVKFMKNSQKLKEAFEKVEE
ncbi:MAG: hypothetical protein ABIG42_12270 [bacterium]